MPTRIACVGYGWVAERHLAVFSQMPDVTIVGLAGRSAERAKPLAARYNAPVFADTAEMLDATTPDALLICTIPGDHGAIEQAAIERGIPFLVEKPLAANWQTAAHIAAAVEQAKLVTAVAYHWRYHETVAQARAFLENRTVALVQGFWLDATPPPAWWSQQAESGGQLVEQATHLFDLARYLVGEATQVFGMAARFPRVGSVGDVDEVSAASVRYASGAIGNFAATCLLTNSYRIGLHLFGDNFAVEIGERLLVIHENGKRREFHSQADPFIPEDAAFLQAVRTGDSSGIRSNYADALRTHRLTTQARASATHGGYNVFLVSTDSTDSTDFRTDIP